jgi:hypothetical protein
VPHNQKDGQVHHHRAIDAHQEDAEQAAVAVRLRLRGSDEDWKHGNNGQASRDSCQRMLHRQNCTDLQRQPGDEQKAQRLHHALRETGFVACHHFGGHRPCSPGCIAGRAFDFVRNRLADWFESIRFFTRLLGE